MTEEDLYRGDIENDQDEEKRQWGLYRMNLLKIKQFMRLRLKQNHILKQAKIQDKIDEIRSPTKTLNSTKERSIGTLFGTLVD